MSINHESELRFLESSLDQKTFTEENTRLYQVSEDFPHIYKNTFVHLLKESFERQDFSVLELGGGITQQTALEIVKTYSNIRYVGVDKRPLLENTKKKLLEFNKYSFIQAGISEIQDKFVHNSFDLIFAHNVGKHLPNPFYMVELAYPLLKPNGIFFTNRIPIYKNEWTKIERHLNEVYPGMLFSEYVNPPLTLIKAGVIHLSFGVRKVNEVLNMPIDVGESYITDITGLKQDTHKISYKGF